ncbi:MAG: ATP-binding cassette, subfamily multidrug efflux pump [Gaiellales bacterium]|nr:ATP-binding cassette, subfamily multidrug efflux pump [Gaiellales bacterium]MDX6591875.1 ATP-binding cassette, subfamily multidrug efflux pump [Gaiellales bacterium]
MRATSFGSSFNRLGTAAAGLGLRRTSRRVAQLIRYTSRYKGRATIAILALLGTTATTIAGPVVAKQAIDRGIIPGDFGAVQLWVAVFLAVALAGWLFGAVQSYLTTWVGERVLTDLRTDLFSHVQELELGYFERTRAGVLISRLTNDIEALNNLVTEGPTTLVQNTITLIGSAAVLLWLDWRLALATLVVFPGMSIGTAIFRRYSSRAYRRTRERLGEVTANLQEDISGVRVVQAFRREEPNYRRFLDVNGSYRDANVQTVNVSAFYFPFVDLLSAIAMAVVLGYGGVRVLNGEITAGELFVFIGLLSNFFEPVQQLSQFYQTFLAGTAALDKVFEVLDTEPEMVDKPGAKHLPQIHGDVRFEDVQFAYRADTAEVLHRVSFTVRAGQTVALVGHTGAGKSTIVKLLSRFYDPSGGRVLIDGHDLRDVTMESVRAQLGIVPQEAFLFAGSVRDNIAFGRPEASDDDVVAAAQAVGADEFIRELPEGYDTQIEERGARLSIGQRQLVAFARALLANPRLLILDEATSSVDIPTEARIERALETLLADRTAFVVAHRLSTIRRADLIVVLEHGEVIESGTHDELIARRGRYFSLYDDWVENVA